MEGSVPTRNTPIIYPGYDSVGVHADVVLPSPHYYHHIIKLEIAPVPLFRQLTALHALVIHISMPPQRVPCDICRQRRVRCAGGLPCTNCLRIGLDCKYEYVPKRRGPSSGSGKRIAALKAAQLSVEAHNGNTAQKKKTEPTSKFLAINLANPAKDDKTSRASEVKAQAIASVDTLSEDSDLSETGLLVLVKRCVRIYMAQMYPIFPIFNPAEMFQMLDRPLRANERSMLLALCALVTTFMCRCSESIFGGLEWEPTAQYFLKESLATRSRYDYVQDDSLLTLLASFFISTTHFELHNIRRCWFYLREAITFAQVLGLHTEHFYHGLGHLDKVYCRRIYYILFITERTRSFAISRYKPVLFSKALPLLADAPEEDQSEIDIGLRKLTRVYSQLGIEFIDNWCQIGSGSSHFSKLCPNFKFHLNTVSEDCSFASDIQKANIMVTEHWLKLVFWKSALQNGALLWDAKMRSMTSSYPEDIALSLLQTLSSLPSESVEIHGLGIFEKVFDVASVLADIIHCSTRIGDRTLPISNNLDRLHALWKHLHLTPNSSVTYAKVLEPQVVECFLSYRNSVSRELAFDVSYCGDESVSPEGRRSPNVPLEHIWDGVDSGQLLYSKQDQQHGVKIFHADAWSAPGFYEDND
ncbi:hypothetical protein V498_09472 [Pseudogymnoascus sp. VKM F-4517 (FW-2822)]|nr:hypothetical protein V498_09472 [Pseudogymnoascus sp. VKM F-4517 (FW-2822)]